MERQSKTGKIVIILLVVLIALCAGILAASLFKDRGTPTTTAPAPVSESATAITNDALDTLLEEQPMYADGIKYFYANSSKELQHDAMGATVFNNSDVNIQSFTIAFCAFDENDNPIKIRQPDEDGAGAYIRTVSYDLSAADGDKKYIAPLESFDNVIFYVNNEPQIVTIKACVKSYTSVDGIKWNNSFYGTFKANYAGKKLNAADVNPQ